MVLALPDGGGGMLRIDLRTVSRPVIEEILDALPSEGYVLLEAAESTTVLVVEPERGAVREAIARSRSARFVADPHRFLEDLSKS